MLRNVRFSDTLSWTPRNAGACHSYCLISAFTAIELVGVLSIIALLASALVPQVIKTAVSTLPTVHSVLP